MSKRLNMAKWIVALRSGKYKQTTGTLKNEDNQYCCLGVACNISKLGKWEAKRDINIAGDVNIEYVIGKDRDGGVLPTKVSKWLGLDSCNPILEEDLSVGHRLLATEANDMKGLTFGEIADKLEARYLSGTTAKAVITKARKRASN